MLHGDDDSFVPATEVATFKKQMDSLVQFTHLKVIPVPHMLSLILMQLLRAKI
ncbi:MAG: hypothetical protein WDM90_23180 [Ferruginibacter sp.]